jgi:hypothetical protein
MLAWSFLGLKVPDILSLHPTITDIACSVLYFSHECYGVKLQALTFLCRVTNYLINTEDDSETQTTLKVLY